MKLFATKDACYREDIHDINAHVVESPVYMSIGLGDSGWKGALAEEDQM